MATYQSGLSENVNIHLVGSRSKTGLAVDRIGGLFKLQQQPNEMDACVRDAVILVRRLKLTSRRRII